MNMTIHQDVLKTFFNSVSPPSIIHLVEISKPFSMAIPRCGNSLTVPTPFFFYWQANVFSLEKTVGSKLDWGLSQVLIGWFCFGVFCFFFIELLKLGITLIFGLYSRLVSFMTRSFCNLYTNIVVPISSISQDRIWVLMLWTKGS